MERHLWKLVPKKNGKSSITKSAVLDQKDEKFRKILAEVNRKFGPALKRLADGARDQDKNTEV